MEDGWIKGCTGLTTDQQVEEGVTTSETRLDARQRDIHSVAGG